jgi:L-fuculose-phosphate aldolase
MKPFDLCLVDTAGQKLGGCMQHGDEILSHLEILKRQPSAVAVVHCQPPYATAFGIAGVTPPTCLVPEMDLFIGVVPMAPYLTPGSPELGKLVADLSDEHTTMLLSNQGAIAWSNVSVDDAYFKMEVLEGYCRKVAIASQMGTPLKTFAPAQLKELLRAKQAMNIADPRLGLTECELCKNEDWPGSTCAVTTSAYDPEVEALVKVITERIMEGTAR